jgi:hypothetical protein
MIINVMTLIINVKKTLIINVSNNINIDTEFNDFEKESMSSPFTLFYPHCPCIIYNLPS